MSARDCLRTRRISAPCAACGERLAVMHSPIKLRGFWCGRCCPACNAQQPAGTESGAASAASRTDAPRVIDALAQAEARRAAEAGDTIKDSWPFRAMELQQAIELTKVEQRT